VIEAQYWWDEAARFREQARSSSQPEQGIELLELAEVCEAVAANAEDRVTGG
jgi:hypothetical protein